MSLHEDGILVYGALLAGDELVRDWCYRLVSGSDWDVIVESQI